MSIEELFRNLESKDRSMAKAVAHILSTRKIISFLVDNLFALDARVRYESAGLLRLVAAANPQMLYPHFNSLRDGLKLFDPVVRGDILKMLRQLVRVDTQKKIDQLTQEYGFSPLKLVA